MAGTPNVRLSEGQLRVCQVAGTVMSHQVAVTKGESEGQSRVCCVAGTPNAIKGEGQSRVCHVAGTPNVRE